MPVALVKNGRFGESAGRDCFSLPPGGTTCPSDQINPARQIVGVLTAFRGGTMPRSLLLCLVVLSLTFPMGCRMCASPYDECGPMPGGACTGNCDSTARAGSILSVASNILPPQEVHEHQGQAAPLPETPRPQGKTSSTTDAPLGDGWKSSKLPNPAKSGLP